MIGCMLTWGDCFSTTFAETDDPRQVAGEKPVVPVDRGPREYATGEAVLDASGTPIAYVVAAGDTINLEATTIFIHGDENGVVHEGSPPSPIPPQRP